MCRRRRSPSLVLTAAPHRTTIQHTHTGYKQKDVGGLALLNSFGEASSGTGAKPNDVRPPAAVCNVPPRAGQPPSAAWLVCVLFAWSLREHPKHATKLPSKPKQAGLPQWARLGRIHRSSAADCSPCVRSRRTGRRWPPSLCLPKASATTPSPSGRPCPTKWATRSASREYGDALVGRGPASCGRSRCGACGRPQTCPEADDGVLAPSMWVRDARLQAPAPADTTTKSRNAPRRHDGQAFANGTKVEYYAGANGERVVHAVSSGQWHACADRVRPSSSADLQGHALISISDASRTCTA